MTIRRTSRVLAVLVCLALWPVHTSAQQGAWERHMRAGEAAYQQGDYAEAVNQTKASLKAAEAFGSDDPRLATSLNNLAVICEAQGWYGEAEPLFQRSLVTREMAFGPEHLDVAASLNNLASLYRALGKYAEAKPPHKRALRIMEEALDWNIRMWPRASRTTQPCCERQAAVWRRNRLRPAPRRSGRSVHNRSPIRAIGPVPRNVIPRVASSA